MRHRHNRRMRRSISVSNPSTVRSDMPDQHRRVFKIVRRPPQKWVPVRRACLNLYKVPCLTVLLLFAMYCTSIFVDDGNRKSPTRPPSEKFNTTLKVLVLSYFRSGSSFTGDVLRSFPGSFYYFEPLRWFNDSKNYTLFRRFIVDLFDCYYTPWEAYLQWTENWDKHAFRRNENFWRFCAPEHHTQSGTGNRRKRHTFCFNRLFVSRFCRSSNFRVMKVARLPFSETVPLLEQLPELRVIHLVRDPRGVMHSRSQELVAVWCRTTAGCSSPSDFCSTLNEDLERGCLAANQFPEQYLFLRYEDLACQPEAVARMLFDFLGVGKLHAEVGAFLESHTQRLFSRHLYLTSPYTTMRNSSAVAFQWRVAMSPASIDKVETACHKTIRKLNYDLFNASSSDGGGELQSCEDIVSRNSNSSQLIAEYASYALSCPYGDDSE